MLYEGAGMKARDTSMTLEEFKKYYDSHRGVISSVQAYEASGNRWADVDELFQKSGAFTLIIVKFKNNSFLRVNVKPSLQVRFSPERYSSPSAWKSWGIDLTYEEKEFLRSVDSTVLTLDELKARIEASTFEGKDKLLQKIKIASEKMRE